MVLSPEQSECSNIFIYNLQCMFRCIRFNKRLRVLDIQLIAHMICVQKKICIMICIPQERKVTRKYKVCVTTEIWRMILRKLN